MPFKSPFPVGPRPAKSHEPLRAPDPLRVKRWLSVSQAAKILQIEEDTVRDWIASGALLAKPVRHGPHWRYRILKAHWELFCMELETIVK
jgi:excisionase family DNA binding protein